MSISDRLNKWIKDSEDVLEAVLEGDIDPEAFTDGRGGQALAALRAVLDVCDSTTLQVRPYGDDGPYTVVRVDHIRHAITELLEES